VRRSCHHRAAGLHRLDRGGHRRLEDRYTCLEACLSPPKPAGWRGKVEGIMADSDRPGAGKRVALFVTCLVDMFRPSVGYATVKLLRDAGCVVEVPPSQTCCGQPAYNSG